ncbi:MAG: trypsin-like peptidase domain-containing protein [Oscillospiraceae bacterium]|nr:trypsin-like peptidase domain-containing protein [Oscillospiraceae bacterium]
MALPEENGNNEKKEPISADEAFSETPENDYGFPDGRSDAIYSDAHYVPENENTEPPRYYKPPERTVKVSVSTKKKKKDGFFVKALCLCLVCALLGGLGGAAIVSGRMNERLAALEETAQQAAEDAAEKIGAPVDSVQPSPAVTIAGGGEMTLSQIYALACEQVVGITTEVTYQNFFGQTSSAAVSGSGFILSADGYILTNYHVIEYAHKGGYKITVMLHDGTRYEASIVGTEESNDVAVLKIEAAGLTPARLGDSASIAVGDEVHAVGNPLGELEFSMTNGHVSALDRVITTEANGDAINMFQIDAPVNSGNSGGPVYNARGEVIGVVTAKYSSTGVEGLGFAIPINDAAKIANDLITKGYVTGKAYMGITPETSEQYQWYAQYIGLPAGACVKDVEKGSCAEKAGLRSGDIITRLGDDTIESVGDLRQALRRHSAGDTVEIEFIRADQTITADITFDEAKPAGA